MSQLLCPISNYKYNRFNETETELEMDAGPQVLICIKNKMAE